MWSNPVPSAPRSQTTIAGPASSRLRGDGPSLTLTPRLRIIVVGPNKADYAVATLRDRAGEVLAVMPINGRSAALAPDAVPLSPGEGYQLELSGAGAAPATFAVAIQDEGSRMAILEP